MLPFEIRDLSQAFSLIKTASHIAILAHYKPDADSLSASAAFSVLCKKWNISHEIIYPGGNVDPVPHTPTPLQTTHTKIPDLLIACDTANYERMYYPESFSTIPLILIDHHMQNLIKADYSFVFTQASSTCEIIADMFFLLEIPLTTQLASILLYGILCDTMVFKTQGTTANTLEAAARLVSQGAPLYELIQQMVIHTDPRIIQLWGKMMLHSCFDSDESIVWTTLSQEELESYSVNETALNGFVNILSTITKTDTTILFYQHKNRSDIKVSFRSKKKNVQKIANTLGGGGHKNAAGVILKDHTLSQAITVVLTAFNIKS